MIRRMCLVWTLILIPAVALCQEERALSLEEAIKIAIERNLDIQLQRITVNNQALNIDNALVAYEPVVQVTTGANNSTSEPATTTQGAAGSTITTNTNQLSANLNKSEWFGFNWGLSFANNSREDDADDSFGKSFGGSLTFSFSQQLLKGFSLERDVMRNSEYVAESNLAIAKHDLEIRINSVLQQVEEAYWDLVSAIDQLKVDQESLDLAKQLYDQNKIKIDVGTLAPIELVNAEAQIADRELAIIRSRQSVRSAEDRLKSVLNLPFKEWSKTITPTDDLSIGDVKTNFEMDFQIALKNRPEVKKDMESLRQANLDLKVQKNNLLPELSLSGSYTLAGSALPQNGLIIIDPDDDPVPVRVDPSNNEVWDKILKAAFPQWGVQLSTTWRPFNKQGRVNRARSQVSLRQTEISAEQNRILIMQDVRNAIRDLEANALSIKAAENSVRFQRENLRAEEQKFQNGLSTNYEVSQAQRNLSDAETSLISSKVAFRKSVITYYIALGVLSKERSITIK
ncbi:MAG: TolC family protein [Acidobacteriota bacterium]|nr:TolC family protein [Acidobacteriota bacterium]